MALEQSLASADYLSADMFTLEKEHIFLREWVAVCRDEEITGAGAYRVFDVAGESLLVIRGADANLRAFYNVCRHRGARLCPSDEDASKPARVQLRSAVLPGGGVRCPYHSWTYDVDGSLRTAPFLSASDLPGGDFALYPAGCECWGGFVFLNLTPRQAPALSSQLGAIPDRIANYALQDLRIARTITYDVAANWKIICENYNECYHCGPMHPELCDLVPAFRQNGGSSLDWDNGVPHRPGADTFTWSGTSTRASLPALSGTETVNHKGELAYPNLFLSLARDHVAAFILQPRSAERTTIRCHFLFAADAMEHDAFDPTDAVEFWNLVNQQDWTICERVQQGISTHLHRHGYYAPMEQANLDMRSYVNTRLQR